MNIHGRTTTVFDEIEQGVARCGLNWSGAKERVGLIAVGGGCPFGKEDRLTASLATANHDPALLARPQAQICSQAFVDRLTAVRPGREPPRRRWLPFFTGFEVLPLRLS